MTKCYNCNNKLKKINGKVKFGVQLGETEQTPQKTKDLICPICKGIFSRDKKHTCTCHILKNNTQTPPTLKDDLTSYWVEWNEQYDVYDDVNKIIAEKIKRLRDKIKINGNLHTESCEHCLITGYTARHENMIFELIDEIMGDWE